MGIDFDSFRYFDIKGLDASVFQHLEAGGYNLIEPLDTIDFRDHTGIYLYYQADYHAVNFSAPQSWLDLMPKTMACSFIGGFDGSKTEKLVELTVTTLNDFDETHPANSSINDLLEVQIETFETDVIPLTEFLDNQLETIKKQALQLNLIKAPTEDREFHFKAEVMLSTGENYEVESSPVYFGG